MPFPGTSFLNSASFLSVGTHCCERGSADSNGISSRRSDTLDPGTAQTPPKESPGSRKSHLPSQRVRLFGRPVTTHALADGPTDTKPPRFGTARQHARDDLPARDSPFRRPITLSRDITGCSLQIGQSRRSIQADPGRQPPRTHGPRVEPLGAPGRQAPLLLDRSSCGEPMRRPLHRRLRLQHSVCNACDTLSISNHRLLPASRSPGGHG
jgi:hypothetical protein